MNTLALSPSIRADRDWINVAVAMALLALCASTCAIAMTPPLDPPTPSWATAHGTDAYGSWADLTVAGAVQSFRLITPGSFLMGSSDDEKAAAVTHGHVRLDWIAGETQHRVVLTHGFWMADSPCTQALWQAVTGSNPSRFNVDAGRPVDQVPYDQCLTFLSLLSGRFRGAGFRLPTEAEWEYACRAGTTTATYAGDIDY